MELLTRVYNWILLKICKNEIESLAPVDTIREEENASLGMLKNVISDLKNHNIAVSGKFGAGKSSIIKSFFKGIKRIFYKPIYISLGMLNLNSIGENNVEEFCQQIEKSIIQQIIYTERKSKLADSNIKRVDKLKKINTFWISVILIGIIAFKISSLYVTDYNEKFKEVIEKFMQINIVWKIIITILLLLIVVDVAFFIAKILKKLDIKNIKLSFSNTEIETSNDSLESLINTHMDELVYFFTATRYNIVVIEDLDRFLKNDAIKERVLIIFQKLKELNQILNSSKQIKRRIVFLYVVKDDVFYNDEERTKFFDAIVPVIPVASNYNSYADLKNRFEQFKINDKTLQEIAPYINDLRVIKNIKNEYTIYKNELDGEEIIDNKLFAMIALKNIRPMEYEKLLTNEGETYELLQEKNKYIIEKQKELRNIIKNNEDKIKAIRNEKIKDITEIKRLAISGLHGKNGDRSVGDPMSLNEFLSEKIDYDFIRNNKINLQAPNGLCYSESVLFEYFGGKESFLERLYNASKENEVDKFIIDNNKIEKEMENMYKKPLYQVLEDKDDIKIEDRFIKMLIINGYLDESYQDYMFKFKETKEIKKHDYTYMSRVRQYAPNYNFNYKIENAAKVIEQLDISFFGTEAILNYDILDQLLTMGEPEIEEKLEKFLDMLSELTAHKESFIIGFLERSNNIDLFIDKFYSISKNIFYELLVNNYKNKPKVELIIKNILRNPNLMENDKINKFVKDYLEEKQSVTDWIDINENVKDSLVKLGIKFRKLNGENIAFINFIYENEMYLLNEDMIKVIFKNRGLPHDSFERQNLSSIMHNDDLKELKEYIEKEKEQYIRECYLKTTGDKNELSDVILCINTWGLDDELVERIIDKINVQIKDIKQLNCEYWNYCIEKNKIEPKWENYYYCFENNDNEITTNLLRNIEINFNILKEQDINNLEIPEDQIDNFRNFQETLQRNNEIGLDIYKEIIRLFNMNIDELVVDEIDKQRLEILVAKKLIIFNNDNLSVIKEQSPELIQIFVGNNIETFLANIASLQLDQETICFVIKASNIKFRDKNRILKIINLEYLNEDVLQYIVENNSQNRISNIKQEIKERIFTSQLNVETKLALLESELQKNVPLELIKKYVEYLPKPYCFIGDVNNNKFSIPKSKNNIQIIKLMQKVGFNISFSIKVKVIMIYNKV